MFCSTFSDYWSNGHGWPQAVEIKIVEAATGGSLTGRNGNVKFCIAACVHYVADIKCRGCIACHFDWQGINITKALHLYYLTAMLLFSLSCVVLPATRAWSSWKV